MEPSYKQEAAAADTKAEDNKVVIQGPHNILLFGVNLLLAANVALLALRLPEQPKADGPLPKAGFGRTVFHGGHEYLAFWAGGGLHSESCQACAKRPRAILFPDPNKPLPKVENALTNKVEDMGLGLVPIPSPVPATNSAQH